jgi:uncharacterized membrane protein
LTTLILGLVLFLATHSMSRLRGLRDGLEAKLGAMPFKGAYSLAALAGFTLIIVGYGQYRAAGMIPVWDPPAALRHVAWLLMLPAYVVLIAAYAPGRIKAVVAHPMLASVKLWALAHLLVNGDLGSMALFGSFLAWAVFARVALGKAERPSVPWSAGDAIAGVGGIVAWVVTLLWLHPTLIGVPAT